MLKHVLCHQVSQLQPDVGLLVLTVPLSCNLQSLDYFQQVLSEASESESKLSESKVVDARSGCGAAGGKPTLVQNEGILLSSSVILSACLYQNRHLFHQMQLQDGPYQIDLPLFS
ncbi:hypothetical protein Peur_050660 [Populus x canadensis]